jgi:hypothetical protein
MEAGEFLAFHFFGSHPANPAAGISKAAGNVKPLLPNSKNLCAFASLRLCVKNDTG